MLSADSSGRRRGADGGAKGFTCRTTRWLHPAWLWGAAVVGKLTERCATPASSYAKSLDHKRRPTWNADANAGGSDSMQLLSLAEAS